MATGAGGLTAAERFRQRVDRVAERMAAEHERVRAVREKRQQERAREQYLALERQRARALDRKMDYGMEL